MWLFVLFVGSSSELMDALARSLGHLPAERLMLLSSALEPLASSDRTLVIEALLSTTSGMKVVDESASCPEDAPESDDGGSSALSTAVAKRLPAFVRATSPISRPDSNYYFRPRALSSGPAAALEADDVFEKCAARCLTMNDECWFFSTSPKLRDCTIHTKLFGFTSSTV
jgi:hypothetical protein